VFYTLTSMVQWAVGGELREVLQGRRMLARIEALTGHHILCGFGRVGEEIASELADRGIQFVVIEPTPESAERARERGHLVVQGDATEDQTLEAAGVRRARTLIAASDSDAGNTYITLSAKAMNPQVFVVARVGSLAAEAKLPRAAADRVISPYQVGGRRAWPWPLFSRWWSTLSIC